MNKTLERILKTAGAATAAVGGITGAYYFPPELIEPIVFTAANMKDELPYAVKGSYFSVKQTYTKIRNYKR